jgi:hypothetical protein
MIHREAHSVNAHIAGLCASDTELFASCPHDNTIRVFDAETMRLLRQWRMERPGPMAMDWQGTLWILQLSGDDGCARVMRFNTNGKKLAQEIVLPEGVVPTDICIDRRHRQFVFNNTFYAPVAETSNVIDRGVDVGLPFRSRAPDLGAFEFGAEPWTLDDIPKPR